LDRRRIQYTISKNKIFFELPEEFQKYTVVTPEVAQEIAPLATQVTRGLHALYYTKMARFGEPLTYDEARLLMEAGVALTL
jgi:hypothetical protein